MIRIPGFIPPLMFIVGVLAVEAAIVFAFVYAAARIAIRHEHRNSN